MPSSRPASLLNGAGPASGDPVLGLDGISVRFSGLSALEGVTLTVGAGEVVSLIGPNGAGKTTMFNVVAGEQRHEAGTVRILGEEISRLSPQDRSKRGVVRTFQRMQLFDGLSVWENLIVARELTTGFRVVREMLHRGRVSDGDAVDADEVLEVLGLTRVADRAAAELPTGIRRMVELGRTLMVDCHLILLDEPTSGLDPQERAVMKRVIRSMPDVTRRRSVLLVEHDMGVALDLADRAYVLDFGRIIASGAADDVRADPKVQAAYLGMGL